MLYKFKCPICNQEYAILLQALFRGIEHGMSKFLYECPITRITYYILVQLTYEMEKTYSREDLAAAERDASIRDHTWKMEEEGNADSNTRTT